MSSSDSDGSERRSSDADAQPDADAAIPPGITFASADDAACYHALVARSRALDAERTSIEVEQCAILRRAHWSLDAVLEWDG